MTRSTSGACTGSRSPAGSSPAGREICDARADISGRARQRSRRLVDPGAPPQVYRRLIASVGARPQGRSRRSSQDHGQAIDFTGGGLPPAMNRIGFASSRMRHARGRSSQRGFASCGWGDFAQLDSNSVRSRVPVPGQPAQRGVDRRSWPNTKIENAHGHAARRRIIRRIQRNCAAPRPRSAPTAAGS
jgi:hypothetical protein